MFFIGEQIIFYEKSSSTRSCIHAIFGQKKNLDLDIPKGLITKEVSYAHTNNVEKENLKEECLCHLYCGRAEGRERL